jgi:hypothetical protein
MSVPASSSLCAVASRLRFRCAAMNSCISASLIGASLIFPQSGYPSSSAFSFPKTPKASNSFSDLDVRLATGKQATCFEAAWLMSPLTARSASLEFKGELKRWPILTRHELIIQPTPTNCNERVDYFGNVLCFFTVQEPHKVLTVESRSEVEVDGDHTNNAKVSLPWEQSNFPLPRDDSWDSLEARQFQLNRPASENVPSTPLMLSSHSLRGAR